MFWSVESATAGELTEHSGDGLIVLSCQYFGRCEQGSLAARVDHSQHRPQCDQGLARSDLTLEQSLHWLVTGKLGHDLLAHRNLTVGQHERQPIVERLEQSTGARLPRHRSM